MRFEQLSYANERDPRLKRWVIRTIEGLSGRNRFLRAYETWRSEIVAEGDRAAYGEAIATATEFSASIVGQAARLLQAAGVNAPGRFLTPLVHSTVDRALIEAGDGASDDLGRIEG